jgi:hypothetical protein
MSSQEDLKYTKKYLKYKAKYLALAELEQNGGGKWDTFKSVANKAASVAKSAASNPMVQSGFLSAVTAAAETPTGQATLAQAQQYYAKSPNAQLAYKIAQSNPTVQSAMSHPVAQQTMNIASTSSGQQSPDSTWNTLSLEKKQKLINLLPSIQ